MSSDYLCSDCCYFHLVIICNMNWFRHNNNNKNNNNKNIMIIMIIIIIIIHLFNVDNILGKDQFLKWSTYGHRHAKRDLRTCAKSLDLDQPLRL